MGSIRDAVGTANVQEHSFTPADATQLEDASYLTHFLHDVTRTATYPWIRRRVAKE